ncbi:MAG: c-type cytochrome [Candidatus Sulfotelmatobacter sp.]
MKFILGLIVGVLIVPLAAFAYLSWGGMPVAVFDKDLPFEKMLAHKALDARIDKEAPKTAPIPANESNFAAGAEIYKQHCAVCHSLEEGGPTAIAIGEYPKPPKLLQGKGVTDDEPGETYWKVANGIRLTGMPGFKQSLSDTQMWQVSLLLAQADKIPATVKQSLMPAPAAPPAAPLPAAATPAPR